MKRILLKLELGFIDMKVFLIHSPGIPPFFTICRTFDKARKFVKDKCKEKHWYRDYYFHIMEIEVEE